MFGPIPHITLMRQILKFLDNLRKIPKTDISNGKPCLFNFIWTYNFIGTQSGNQPLSWYSQIIFWL